MSCLCIAALNIYYFSPCGLVYLSPIEGFILLHHL